MKVHRVVDLRFVAEKLPLARKEFRQLVGDARALHSAHSDLKISHDLAARLLQLDDAQGLPADFVEDCGLALLCSAIVFYARATKSASDHRKTFDIRPKMDAEERERHDMLVRLRDDAFAHYGPSELGTATVRSDWLLFSLKHEKLLAVSRNIVGSKSLARLIREQSQRALILMQRLYEEKQAQLLKAVGGLADDEEFGAAWNSATSALREVVGGEMAAQIDAGSPDGMRRLSERP